MTRLREDGFRLRDYLVAPSERAIHGPAGIRYVSDAAMDLLVDLAERNADGDSLLLPSDSQLGLVDELDACFGRRSDDEPIIARRDGGLALTVDVAAPDGESAADAAVGTTGDRRIAMESGPASDPRPKGKGGWFATLSRRRVFRVLGSYAVSAWLVLQITDVLSGVFPLPDWFPPAVATVLALGFPVAAGVAWLFQVTPRGVVLDVESNSAGTVDRARLVHFIDLVIIGVLLVIVGLLSFGRFFPRLAADTEIRVAVMPFQTLGTNAADDYLSEGLADDIRSRLYDIPQLLVAARKSSDAVAAQGLDIAAIGERLTVQHLLDGTVRRAGDQIRVAVELVDVETGFKTWHKTYDSSVDNILDLQSSISLFVASELELLLTRDLRKALAEDPTENGAAYDRYLQARRILYQPRSPESLDDAERLFREAVELDPTFALGFAGLCQTFIVRYEQSGETRYVSTAELNCRQALSLNRELSGVHTALGGLYLSMGRLDESRAAYGEALSLDNRAVDASIGLGDVLARLGEFGEAEQHYREAIERQPANWDGYNRYAAFLVQTGRYAEAADNYRRILNLTPDNAQAYSNLGATQFLLGDFTAAAGYYAKSLELAPGRAAYSNTGTMHYYAGEYEAAAAMFRKAAEEAAGDYRLWGNLADAQRFLKDGSEAAARSYAKAIDLANDQLQLDPNDTTARVNLAWYLVNSGDRQNARSILRGIDLEEERDPERLYTAGLAWSLLGERERSDAYVAKALQTGFPRTIVEATVELQE